MLSTVRELPLFPLNTVLFPGMVLPLHIFEERYRIMIRRCIDENMPFGVVLIRDGAEVGGGASVFDIGTTAHITQVDEMEDGRMNIATLGFHRFKIQNLHTREPYLSGIVEDFPLENTDDQQVDEEVRQLAPMLLKYLEIMATISESDLTLEKVPDDPTTLAFLTAIVLKAPMGEKQEILSIPSLPELLRHERQMLVREAQVLRLMIESAPGWLDDGLRPFSPN